MKRRSYIALAGGALTGGLAAATTTDTSLNDARLPEPLRRLAGPNQWGHNPVTVTTIREDGVSISSGFDQRLAAALTYWETNSETYTEQTVSFDRIEPDSPMSADIVFTITEAIKSCGDHEADHSFAGCAPRITGRPRTPIHIEIRASNRGAYLQEVLKHELGHVLGLAHSDPPQSVMSTDMADRLPDYPERRETYYSYGHGIAALNTAWELYEDASTAVGAGDYEASITPVEGAIDHFQTAGDRFSTAANLVSEIDDAEIDRLNIALENAQTAALAFETAMTHLHDAITAALDGDTAEKHAQLRTHTAAHNRAVSIDIADARTIAQYLHLPLR